jgi:hypothetical protein
MIQVAFSGTIDIADTFARAGDKVSDKDLVAIIHLFIKREGKNADGFPAISPAGSKPAT